MFMHTPFDVHGRCDNHLKLWMDNVMLETLMHLTALVIGHRLAMKIQDIEYGILKCLKTTVNFNALVYRLITFLF